MSHGLANDVIKVAIVPANDTDWTLICAICGLLETTSDFALLTDLGRAHLASHGATIPV